MKRPVVLMINSENRMSSADFNKLCDGGICDDFELFSSSHSCLEYHGSGLWNGMLIPYGLPRSEDAANAEIARQVAGWEKKIDRLIFVVPGAKEVNVAAKGWLGADSSFGALLRSWKGIMAEDAIVMTLSPTTDIAAEITATMPQKVGAA